MNDLNRQIPPFIQQSDLDRLLDETPIREVIFHREVSSTNDVALEIAGNDSLRSPLLVLAERQTAGRGRKTNRWWSAPGSLTFSVLLETRSAGLPQSSWPQVSLTVGLAICEALEKILKGQQFLLKWPNDVYFKRQKVCGVLVESPSGHQEKLILGIGINVNNSVVDAPQEIAGKATALCDLLGREMSVVEVLIQVLNQLCSHLDGINSNEVELRTRWRKRCLLTNHRIRIDLPGGDISGICHGIDDQGALIIQTEAGIEYCLAGTVEILD